TKDAEALQALIQQVSDDLTHEKSALDLSRRRQSDLTAQLDTLSSEKKGLEISVLAERERLATHEIEAQEYDTTFQAAQESSQGMDETVRQARQEADSDRREHDANKRELMTGITQTSDLTSNAASLLSRIEAAEGQTQRLAQQMG